jgi:hypothetical protein
MGMRFDKSELKETVSKNRDLHRTIFEEAIEGYKKKVQVALEEHIDRIKNGEIIRVHIYYDEPVDHTRDYDRLLKMLDMTVETHIELTENQFESYILDDWKWKRQFIATNSAYSTTAAALAEEE